MPATGGRRFGFEEFDALFPARFREAWPVLRRLPRSRPRSEDEVRALARALREVVCRAEREGEYRWLDGRRLRICR